MPTPTLARVMSVFGLALLACATPVRADLYVANSASGTVYASRLASDCGFSTGNIEVGGRPIGLAVHPNGSRLYVANTSTGTIGVIDTATRSVIANIPVGGAPFGPTRVAVHPNGTRAYATTSNRVVVIDTASNSVLTTIFVPGVANGIAVHPAGTHVYVGTQAGYVVVINPGSNSIFTQIPLGVVVFGVAFSPDGTRAYAATANGIDTGWITVLNVLSSTVVTTVPVEGTPLSVAVHPDGTRAFSVNDRGHDGIPERGLLTVIDTSTNTVTGAFPTGRAPHGIAIDARHIYVANQVDASVTVFDRDTHAEVDIMEVGSIPADVATYVPPLPPPLSTNLQVTAIELTQGVQDVDNNVTLIEGRRTFARVHMRSTTGATVFNVTGTLFGVREHCTVSGCNGVNLAGLMPAGGATLMNAVPNPVRSNFGQSLQFELPWDWVRDQLRLYFVPGTGTAAPNACRIDAPTEQVVFDTPSSLDIQFIRAQYDSPTGPAGTRITTTTAEQAHSESWLRRAYPLSNLVSGPDWSFYDPGLLARVNQTHDECAALLTPEEDLRSLCAQRYLTTHPALLDAAVGRDGAYVLIPRMSGAPFIRGACCNNARLGAGPNDPTDLDWSAKYTGHELGHLLGRDHPVKNAMVCGHSATDVGYPHEFALIHPYSPYTLNRGVAGYDPGDTALTPTRPRVFRGAYASHDVMSYCTSATLWLSDYTYENLYNAMRAPTPPVFGNGGGGPQLGDWLMVLGHIMPNPATPAYIQTRRLDRVGAVPTRAAGDHRIRLTNAGGATLADYSFSPEVAADAARQFAHIVPFVAGARTIQIIDDSQGGRVIGTRTISATAPTIGSAGFQGTPNPGSESVTIQWSASDADGDALTTDIFFTRDGGNTLRPLQVGLSGGSAQIDTTEIGGGPAQFRVVVSDGVQSAFRDTPVVNLPNKLPRPRILSPGAALTIVAGQLINFEGSAADLQDGLLPEARLSWEIPGRAPRVGARISIADLPVGTHDVVLTATNSLGLSATATSRIVVNSNTLPLQSALSVGPQQLGWHVPAGDHTVQTATLDLGSIGGTPLGFTATTNASWLSVNPASGSSVPATITVTADPSGLAGGTTKAGEVTLRAVGGSPQTLTVPVTLSVGNTWVVGGVVTDDEVRCASDVSSQIVVTRTGLRLNRATNRYVQQITLRNASAAVISGPISLVLNGLSGNVALFNKTGDTACSTPVGPYINLAGNALSGGQSITLTLEFANPGNVNISYTTRILAGGERR